MNNSSPTFSVIIPTYNRAHIIARAVKSVLLQSFQNFEIIVVDDGSTDNTENIVKSIGDERIIYFKHEKNKGQNAALNTALLAAKGNYIAFLDSDDEWLPTMLEKQLMRYEKDTEISCVYSWAGTIKDNILTPGMRFSLEGYIYKEALTQGYVSHMITLSAKRDCFEKIGNFDEKFVVCQDDDICLRLAENYKFGLIAEPLAIIHSDAGNQTITNKKNYADGWYNLFSKYEDDIISICGNKTAALHFSKVGYLYVLANEKGKARKILLKSMKLFILLKSTLFLLVTFSPFNKLNHKIVSLINYSLK